MQTIVETEDAGAQWLAVTGREDRLWRLRVGLKGSYHFVISRSMLWVLVPHGHRQEFDLLQGEQKELSTEQVTRPPESVRTPCGQYVLKSTGVGKHRGRCVECRKLAGLPKVTNRNLVTLVAVPEMAGSSMDLPSLVLCLETSRDDALGVAEKLDTVISSVREVPQLEAELAELQAKIETYQQAMAHFMGKGE